MVGILHDGREGELIHPKLLPKTRNNPLRCFTLVRFEQPGPYDFVTPEGIVMMRVTCQGGNGGETVGSWMPAKPGQHCHGTVGIGGGWVQIDILEEPNDRQKLWG